MKRNQTPLIWSVGGSDSRAGAGIQADLLTAQDFSVACCTIVSAVTAQNKQGVRGVFPVTAKQLIQQLDTLAEDGLPAYIKVGLLATQEQVVALSCWLNDKAILAVLDPVQIASNRGLLTTENVDLSELFSVCTLITPNEGELVALGGVSTLRGLGVKAVLVTGGTGAEGVLTDHLFNLGVDKEFCWQHTKISSSNSHGTGCTLATAITVFLAKGYILEDAITQAIAYVRAGLRPNAIANVNGAVAHKGWPSQFVDWPLAAVLFENSASFGEGIEANQSKFPRLSQNLGFYPVVDSLRLVENLLRLGVKTLQLRIKQPSSALQLREDIRAAIGLAKEFDAQLFINDYWQLACEFGAYGVHLGQEDLYEAEMSELLAAGLRLGVSTHGFFELSVAKKFWPSYYALGHVFSTTTKEMPSQPQGLRRLSEYASLIRGSPSVAIGGLNQSNGEQVLACGVQGLAVVRAITDSCSLAGTVNAFLGIFDRMKIDANIDREMLNAALP